MSFLFNIYQNQNRQASRAVIAIDHTDVKQFYRQKPKLKVIRSVRPSMKFHKNPSAWSRLPCQRTERHGDDTGRLANEPKRISV